MAPVAIMCVVNETVDCEADYDLDEAQNAKHLIKEHVNQFFKGINKPKKQRNIEKGFIVEKTKEILLGYSGETVFTKVKIQNLFKKAYKKGSHLVSVFDQSLIPCIEEVKLPLDQVEPHQEFEVNIPLKFLEFVSEADQSGPMPAPLVAKFSLQGPGDNYFGEEITIQFRIIKKLDEMQHVISACELSDQGEITFDQAFVALKAASGCYPWALDLIK